MRPEDPEFEPLVCSHLAYAHGIAKQIRHRLPSFLELDDLLGSAELGLVQAALRFDRRRNVQFQSFARRRIRGEILECVRRRQRKHTSTAQLDPKPEYLDILKTEIDEASIDRAEVVRKVRTAVGMLSPETQELLRIRYEDGKIGAEFAEALGLSEARSSQLHRKALDQLRNSAHRKELEELHYMKSPSREALKIDQAKRVVTIDELGAVQDRIARAETAEYKADLKREKELKEEIKTWIPKDLAGSESTSFEGKKYVVTVSEQRNERYVVEGGWKKIMGWMKNRFFEKCSIPVKVLEVDLTEAQQAEVLRKGHVGYRTIAAERIQRETAKAA